MPGTGAKVSGRVAGVPVELDVEVHAADRDRLEISAEPIGLEVRYDLVPTDGGSEMRAWVRVRSGGGLTGRLVTKATSTLCPRVPSMAPPCESLAPPIAAVCHRRLTRRTGQRSARQ